jgi:hypothetical protein
MEIVFSSHKDMEFIKCKDAGSHAMTQRRNEFIFVDD